MKFIFEIYTDDTDDSFIVQADTLEEIQQIAQKEVDIRGWKNYWSEEL